MTTKQDVKKVVDYLFRDEQKHFEEASIEERKNHIFKSVQRLSMFLQETSGVDLNMDYTADQIDNVWPFVDWEKYMVVVKGYDGSDDYIEVEIDEMPDVIENYSIFQVWERN